MVNAKVWKIPSFLVGLKRRSFFCMSFVEDLFY